MSGRRWTAEHPRPHGRARYVLGGHVGDQPCRCDVCRAAARTYEAERKARLEPAYVAATPARNHLAWLATQGVGLKTVAKVSGVAHGALSKLVCGTLLPGGRRRPPSKRIRKATHDAILAVTPSQGSDGSRVPSGPTRARIERLVAAGVPKARIAERAGVTQGNLLRYDFVSRRVASAIAAMHAELSAGTLVTVRRSRHGDQTIAPEAPEPPPVLPGDDVLLALVEMLENRIDQRDWHTQAACRGRPTWMWFPNRGDHQTAAKAKAICGACPVRAECLAANGDERDGIYGGRSARERRAIRKEAAA